MTGERSISQQPLPPDAGGMHWGQVLLLCGFISARTPSPGALASPALLVLQAGTGGAGPSGRGREERWWQ